MINGYKEGDFMQIPKNIQIKNNGKITAYLSPKADGLKDCYADCRLNGESTLEFLLPATSEKIEELTPECEIWANGRVYNLLKEDAVDTIRDDRNRLWTKVMAHERWYELDFSFIEPSISNDPTARPPADLAVIIVGGGNNLSGGLYPTGTAAHALYAILQGSGWSMGTVDVTGIRDLEAEKESRLALIKMVQDIWGGYLIFDSVNKIIHLRDPNKWQPYNGFQIRYRKNLKHITRTQSNKIITKLYPFGHDDLDIAAVNGGKKYITNFSYTSREYIGIYKNQDIYDQQELLEKAQAELELNCRPRYLYKVKLVDVRVLPEYSHEEFALGDMVDIIDPDIAPDSPRPRIIRHKYNIFQPWECELDIGDPEERLIEQLKASFNTTKFVGGKFNGSGKMSGYSIEHDTIISKHIKAGSIEIGHLDEGVVPGLDLLENPIFSSYAADVSNHATLIQQNASAISLQATQISSLGQDISSLSIRADGIESSVSSLSSTVGSHSTQITQLSNQISSKVSYTDYNGETIVSLIEQTPASIKLSAEKIDLTGITSIYSPNDTADYFTFYGNGVALYENNIQRLQIYYDGLGNRFSGFNVTFDTGVNFNSTVNFSEATVMGLTLRFA